MDQDKSITKVPNGFVEPARVTDLSGRLAQLMSIVSVLLR